MNDNLWLLLMLLPLYYCIYCYTATVNATATAIVLWEAGGGVFDQISFNTKVVMRMRAATRDYIDNQIQILNVHLIKYKKTVRAMANNSNTLPIS